MTKNTTKCQNCFHEHLDKTTCAFCSCDRFKLGGIELDSPNPAQLPVPAIVEGKQCQRIDHAHTMTIGCFEYRPTEVRQKEMLDNWPKELGRPVPAIVEVEGLRELIADWRETASMAKDTDFQQGEAEALSLCALELEDKLAAAAHH